MRNNDVAKFGPDKLIDDQIDNSGLEGNWFTKGSLEHPWFEIALNQQVEVAALEFTAYGYEVKTILDF